MSELFIRLIMLFSFCGGPLYVADILQPALNQMTAFVVAFFPLGLIALGLLAFAGMRDDHADDPEELYPVPLEYWERLDRYSVYAGLAGVVALVGMDVFSMIALSSGGSHANAGLIAFGNAVGLFTAWYYGREYVRSKSAISK